MLVLLRAVEKQMGLVLTLASLAIGWKLMAVQIVGMGTAEPMTQVEISRLVFPVSLVLEITGQPSYIPLDASSASCAVRHDGALSETIL